METKNKYLWIYLTGFFLILTLPFLSLSPWFSPPDWGKTIVFRSILAILLFIFIWQTLQEKKLSIKTSKTLWLLIALLGIFFLATLFSLDRTFSFWGSPHRSDGFLNFAFYIIFAILAFLILRKSDWQKIWIFSFIIGILVSFIAIFQRYNIFSKIVIPYDGRPPSTIGGPIFLGLYLLLLSFMVFSFLLKEKEIKKKLFYLLVLLLFIYVIFLTGSRAVYLGLFIGLTYFILTFPKKGNLIFGLKILFLVLILLGACGVYYLNAIPETGRFSIKLFLEDPRFSGWKVSFEALKEKPILGYGPENFSIGFDKYYDPSLPYINKAWGSWWDRAHNFLLDIGISAGIPALIIYLLLFASIFWNLQKIKKDKPEKALICHSIQTAFIGYLTANFFGFDTFSTYLISFLMIAFSLSLISQNLSEKTITIRLKDKIKYPLIFILFITLIWFIWAYNIKILEINKEINLAKLQAKQGAYQKALIRLDKVLDSQSYLDHYLRLNYVEIINNNLAKSPTSLQIELTQKAIKLLEENVKIRPYYTRNWILLGNYTNVLIEKGEIELKEKADSYFRKAKELSPKHQEIFDGWIKTDYMIGNYKEAKEKAQECLDLNESFIECWWLLALSNVRLNEIKEAKENIRIAVEKYYLPISVNEIDLLQLADAYASIENYEELSDIYYRLTRIDPSNAQYHIYLAICYKELNNFEQAKEEALKALELMPEARKQIEEFLKELD